MAPNRARPTLLVVHADAPDRALDPAIGAWFGACARTNGRFDVELLNADALAKQAPRALRPDWRAAVARADAFAFVATRHDAVLLAPLLDLVAAEADPWRFKPFGIVRPAGEPEQRTARTLSACMRQLTAVPSTVDVVLPDAATALALGASALDANLDAQATALLADLARLHASLRPLRPASTASVATGVAPAQVLPAASRSVAVAVPSRFAVASPLGFALPTDAARADALLVEAVLADTGLADGRH